MSSANVLFFFVMAFGPIVSLSSSNWFLVWAGIEISFLGLVPLLFLGSKYMSLNKEAGLKYFCIQALGSALLFMSGVVMYFDVVDSLVFSVLFLFSLSIKLGLFPGHFWVPSIVAGLEWIPCVLMLTWQKIPPFALTVSLVSSSNYLLQELVLLLGGMSALVGGLIGNNQTSLRPMIGASSVAHTGWASVGAVCGSLWLYFILYCLVLVFTASFLWEGNNLLSSMSILSLSGLPPFVMFSGKWMIIKSSLCCAISIKFLILPILGTFISLIFYLKFLYSFYLNSEKVSFKSNISWILPLAFLNLAGVGYIVFL
ncbi:NADH dehydrogenase subunit 2 (mitochondrion) [Aplysia californica]|uniref:NADH-ubiquinone oxidoreductase chain 2 n=1 Tax=Aplysia californica TaxID=6500 RepID=Q6Q0A7_APLCA|nr:NADH dehydrogenase subunit 2 [Aplysia californica]AAS67869.1 NADH dehydrogenase subunit 2 [Aplysia californica]